VSSENVKKKIPPVVLKRRLGDMVRILFG